MTLRLAVLADIHGNLLAFEAALADARKQGVDAIVIAGDIVVGSPDSNECWDLATSLGVPIIRGNHERYVITYGQPGSPPEGSEIQYAPVRWAAERAGTARREAMASLPTLYAPSGSEKELLIVHASLRGDHDSISAHTSDAELRDMFPGEPPKLIVRGHNHVARMLPWGDRLIVTVGSVGLPLDLHTTAQYTILSRANTARPTIEHRSVAYDLDAALQRFHNTGYLAATGPIGQLYYRELATASYQVVPFLRWFKGWKAEAPITLEAALTRFLGALR